MIVKAYYFNCYDINLGVLNVTEMAFVYLSCTLIITSSLINPSLATSDPYVDGRNGTLVAQDVFETSTLTPTDDDSDVSRATVA